MGGTFYSAHDTVFTGGDYIQYKNGIKIKNIKAGTLYGYNRGLRTHYDYIDGVLSYSLFSLYMEKHGMKVWKGESTRDFICLDLDFGSRSYEEELAHLETLLAETDTDADKVKILQLMRQADSNKYKYKKLSKEEIRELFYKDGVSVEYTTHDKKGNVIKQETIDYVKLFRNSAKAKVGQVVFIRRELYGQAYDWLTMGLGSKLPYKNAKIVEMSAYAPLTTSSIIGTLHIPVEDILILEDTKSVFTTTANKVKAQESEYLERVLDEVATAANRQQAIENGRMDLWGNPIYNQAYKRQKKIRKSCVVEKSKYAIENVLWDGMGLIDTDVLPCWVNGMALLRNHFFKMCGFRTNIQKFFKDWCSLNGFDYNTYVVKDMFGVEHRLRDIKVITTDNAIKWKKFSDLMGKTPRSAYRYWCKRISRDGNNFGIVKTDHKSKLGNVQQMSYQMINSLPCSREEIFDIAQTSIDYVTKLKNDDGEFIEYLKKNVNEINHYKMMIDLYQQNNDFASSQWFCDERERIIKSYVSKLRSGKITAEGDNLTLCGNPYALLLHSVGEDWHKDPTLSKENGVIQCYTPRFAHNEFLCGIRSPQNSPNNIVYLHNVYSPEMEKYFRFSDNIIAVNNIETDIQARLNGCDYDSDFIFTTNEPTMVKCAKRCYDDYPTIVNTLAESGITYDNTPEEYARMDNKFAKTRMGIGYSSNLAQLAMTYYWTELKKEHPDEDRLKELYDNFIILSVLA